MRLVLVLIIIIFSTSAYSMQMAITISGIGNCSYKDIKKTIDALKKHRVSEAYGFLDGNDVEFDKLVDYRPKPIKSLEIDKALKLWTASGHALGTEGHGDPEGKRKVLRSANLLFSNPKDMEGHLKNNEPIMLEYAGNRTPKYFRSPGYFPVDYNDQKQIEFRKIFKKLGYIHVPITIEARINDSSHEHYIPDTQVLVKILKDLDKMSQKFFGRSGAQIINFTCNYNSDSNKLDEILTAFSKEGVEFVTLEKAMKDEIYKYEVMGANFFHEVILKKNPNLTSKDLHFGFNCRYFPEKHCPPNNASEYLKELLK